MRGHKRNAAATATTAPGTTTTTTTTRGGYGTTGKRPVRRCGVRGICGNFWALLAFLTAAAMTAIAAYLYDSWSTGKGNTGALFNTVAGSNALLLALIAGSVALCTTLLGFMHSGFWNESARFGALAANTVALGLSMLSLGLNSRSIRSTIQNQASGKWKSLWIAVNALNIILAALLLLYVLTLGILKHDRHVVNNNTGVLPTHHTKTVNDGYSTNAYPPSSTVGGSTHHHGTGAAVGTGAVAGAGTGAAVGHHHNNHHHNNGVTTTTANDGYATNNGYATNDGYNNTTTTTGGVGHTGTVGHNSSGLASGPYTTPQHHPVV